MTARQPALSDVVVTGPQGDPLGALGEFVSSIVEQLGLGWGLLLGLVVPTAVVLAAGAALTVWLWRRTSRTASSRSGSDLFPGQVVTVRTAEGTQGQAFVEGGWWSVRSTGAPLQAGQQVRVRAIDGLVLVVEELATDAANDEEDR